jgi:hypothetical protein
MIVVIPKRIKHSPALEHLAEEATTTAVAAAELDGAEINPGFIVHLPESHSTK